MKRLFMITFIVLIAFCIPSISHGGVLTVDQWRAMEVSASPNWDSDYIIVRGDWSRDMSVSGAGDTYALATQTTTIDSVWVKQFHVYGTGSTSIQGDGVTASSILRANFSINDVYDHLYFPEPVTMMYQISYDLTGGGYIVLNNKYTGTTVFDLSSGTGEDSDILELGEHRLWVESNGNGSFYINFKICAGPCPCEGDSEPDGDVDGLDLAAFAAQFDANQIENFASNFGSTDC